MCTIYRHIFSPLLSFQRCLICLCLRGSLKRRDARRKWGLLRWSLRTRLKLLPLRTLYPPLQPTSSTLCLTRHRPPCQTSRKSESGASLASEIHFHESYLTRSPVHRIVEETQSSPVVIEEIAICFFSLLENILRAENLSTTSTVRNRPVLVRLSVLAPVQMIYILLSQLEDKVQTWQSCPASTLNTWFSAVPCWSDLVLQALQFLAGETKGEKSATKYSCDLKKKNAAVFIHTRNLGLPDGMMALPSGFSPFVEFSDESQQWRWIGKRQTKSQVVVKADKVFFSSMIVVGHLL